MLTTRPGDWPTAPPRGRLEHHSASSQIWAEGADRRRFIWTADVLPDALDAYVSGMMDEGMAVMKRTLEQAALTMDQAAASA